MAIVKMISTDYLKENTLIEFNVDSSKLTQIILKVQSIYLTQVIGSSYYDYLCDGIENSTLNADELNMVRSYIKPFIAEYTVYEALPSMHFKMTDKGVVTQNSEWSESAQLSDVKYMRSTVKDMAEFYGVRLTKYLCDHPTKFPQYFNPDNPENVKKGAGRYFSGIYLPKSKGCNNC